MTGTIVISRTLAMTGKLFRRLETGRLLVTVVVACVLTAILAGQVRSDYEPLPQQIDRTSIALADGMLHAYRLAKPDQENSHNVSSQIAGTPGYPLVLVALALADPAVEKAITCTARAQPCAEDASFKTLFYLQFFLALFTLGVIFILALRLSASWEVALLTLILTFFATKFGSYAASGYSLIWLLSLTYLFLFLAVETHLRHSFLAAFGVGISGGSLALFLPQAAVVVVVVIPLLACLCIRQRGQPLQAALLTITAIAGVAVAGMMLSFALSMGYETNAAIRSVSEGLSARLGYHAMDVQSWVASLIMPLPVVGELAEDVLPETLTLPVRASLGQGNFALLGLKEIYQHSLAQPGHALDQLIWLLDTHVWGQISSYLLVTPTFFLRGVWGGTEFVGLFGVLHMRGMLVLQRANNRLDPVLITLVALGTLLVVNTLLTANYEWTNTALAFFYAYAIAYVIDAYRHP